jgi:formate hydrogenlyase transcriptional activator
MTTAVSSRDFKAHCKEDQAPGARGIVRAPIEHLELATILEVSRAVSGELVRERLVETLLRTAIEHAGAERGLFVVLRGGELSIHAEATAGGAPVMVRLRETPVAAADLPESVVRYAARTRESVVIDDAAVTNPFSTDDYVLGHRIRSVLCLPLVTQASVVGVLYLETRIAGHAFTPSRIALMSLLAAQAATALDNARLNTDLRNTQAHLAKAQHQLHREDIVLREEIDKTSMFEEIAGSSPPLRAVLSHVSKVAPTDSTVLITGETGTGKELIARAIHKRSTRSARAFVAVNCAAIPLSLIASELFGHEKGAFTGAVQRRQGRFELADGGTIFLDEVGELPAEIQVMLLRVLQEREFERAGGSGPIRANVRVIAATNRDLQAAVADGTFRADLFYRLNVFPLEVPSLRERRPDIPLLVEYFVHRFAKRAGKRIRALSERTSTLLQSYDWPGNIRELQNIIERAVIVCDSDTLSIDARWLSGRSLGTAPATSLSTGTLATHEKDAIEAALQESKGRVAGPFGAAGRLGVPASTLESKIKARKIDKQRFKAAQRDSRGMSV